MCNAQEKKVMINPDVYGFATSNTFTYFNVDDTVFSNKVKKINPNVLRFPGGAMGNFYHFNKNGYGFDFEEIEKFCKGSRFIERSKSLERANIQRGHTHDYIDDFIKLAKMTNSKVVLVANMFVDNDDIIKMIDKIQSNELEILGVELGSELSNRSFYLNQYTINEYIKDARSCSEKIKYYFPEIKTAIVAAPLHESLSHRHSIWNNRLSDLDFYDAIIIHSYAKVVKGKKEYGQMITVENEGSNEEEAFDLYKKRTLNFLNSTFIKEVGTYNEIFGDPIWITEWNLQISHKTGNTLLQSLFISQYFLELMSNKDLQNITLTNYHNLAGRDYGGSIFRYTKKIQEIQSTYYPLTLIGKIFDYNIVVIEKEISNKIYTYKCFDEMQVLVFSFEVDWDSHLFKFNFNGITKIFTSDNLFDKVHSNGFFKIDSEIKN